MKNLPYGLIYKNNFISAKDRQEIFAYLSELYPIWEERYSKHNPPPEGKEQRRLLRPVYWLGNWQFACLNYYHPPKGIHNRCVSAEPFPPVLRRLVDQMELLVQTEFQERDIPRGWHLNTCLINYYGSQVIGATRSSGLDDNNGKSAAHSGETELQAKRIDVARVGEHKDFEPGPVASLSLGERALFQFVSSSHREAHSQVVLQQWLEDSCLQIFGADKWKSRLFHRVQRVEKKLANPFSGFSTKDLHTENFETRRINFTFRYVPLEHFVDFPELPTPLQEDVKPYVAQLAKHSEFWRAALGVGLV